MQNKQYEKRQRCAIHIIAPKVRDSYHSAEGARFNSPVRSAGSVHRTIIQAL